MGFSIPGEIQGWKLELLDEGSRVFRGFSSENGYGSAPPEFIDWNGLDEKNAIREGRYVPRFSVSYIRGQEVSVTAPSVAVNVSGPVLGVSLKPEFFSPDDDGEDDILIISLEARGPSPVSSWSLEIREPQPPYAVFYRYEGRDAPPRNLVWDGKSNKGETVQSAMDYPFTFRVQDAQGNASVLEGKIGVDILVRHDGERLYIQVPSIIFRPNGADFNTLSAETVRNNNRVLERVAYILNKFRDYKVQVEGHANPTKSDPAAREREERLENQPLSEQMARYIVDRLVEFKVSRTRLSSSGKGGTQPVAPFEDHDNWWKNRRVEFVLIK
jgi:outer membrane protein OmpA-like peptidoglycan-associated protein